jgi:hypothetical protein
MPQNGAAQRLDEAAQSQPVAATLGRRTDLVRDEGLPARHRGFGLRSSGARFSTWVKSSASGPRAFGGADAAGKLSLEDRAALDLELRTVLTALEHGKGAEP